MSSRTVLLGTALVTASLALAACGTGGGSDPGPTTTVTVGGSTSNSSGSSTAAKTTPKATPTAVKPVGKPVHIKTANADGATYGVGMPIIAYFSKKISDGRTLSAATKVTANGQPLKGAWYFEYSSASTSYPIEGHWRPQNYWPAHSTVHVALPMKGKSAGTGLVYDNSLTLDFAIGASHISTVDERTHSMTVVSDGRKYGAFPVSLGARKTPTLSGTKVIMEKGKDISMRGPGYFEAHVKYTQRLTYGGEYLHAAPWNCVRRSSGCDSNGTDHIGSIDSSNGCTNLLPSDAQRLYGFLEIGDVVLFPNATGRKMQMGEGYGDWNVPWAAWQTGGLVRT